MQLFIDHLSLISWSIENWASEEKRDGKISLKNGSGENVLSHLLS